MPITAIATYFFAAFDGSEEGWTENWYIQGNDLPACLTTAKLYLVPRRNVLSFDWFIEAVRVSDITVLNDSLEEVNLPAEGKGLFRQSGAPVEDCIYMRVEAGAARRRMLPLRGLPINQLAKDNRLDLTANYFAALNGFKAWFTANPGTLKIRQNTRGVGVQVDMHANVRDTRAIDIQPAPGWAIPAMAQGVQFQIAGVPQDKGFGYNGKWLVDVFFGGAITTKPKRKHYTIGLTASGTLYPQTITYPDVSNVFYVKGGARKTGRPFDSPRGRQSATRH